MESALPLIQATVSACTPMTPNRAPAKADAPIPDPAIPRAMA